MLYKRSLIQRPLLFYAEIYALYTTIVKSTRYRFGVSTRKDLYTHYRNLLQVCNKFR